ncbi:low molecular weight phosphatase family protein [Paenibacillus sp. CAA11]|uniref:low molecular weight protein arginine phosphatase n=1 Tax=Paenibacillus sp. CAA11 TaxID=1532905 RepID=UPI000D381ED5|nr:low molecular weight protein arginine phosphatase [Paenibacillus sp. CAA11]AWB47071.1 low molecular weight phosphatase family protein [Paenibacillus sp. CAA11]
MMRILFVCTGNTCRSPMAEGLFRQMAKERGIQAEARSAGVAAMEGMSISRHAEAVLRDHQIEDSMTSSSMSKELAEWADLILTLTQSHKRQVIHAFPFTASKTFALKEYALDDPEVMEDLKELHELAANQALEASLGSKSRPADQQRMIELQQRIPSFDISDPFGGSREDYDRTAAEIRDALDKLLSKLEREGKQ